MSAPLTIGSLFSGIGGLELGLERGIGNGAHTVWQVEQNAYCRAVLAKHWPDATRYEDVRHVGRSTLSPVDVLCGGFPCQDISAAGRRIGVLPGTRSGLWYEYARLVDELRPRYVVVENVAALLVRGIDVVLGCLAELGYDAEWSLLSACAVGAPHARARLFLIAYPNGHGGWHGRNHHPRHALHVDRPWQAAEAKQEWDDMVRWFKQTVSAGDWNEAPASVRGVDDGLPSRLERLRALGNAVVPQVAEVVGRLIAEREAQREVAA